MTTITLSSAFRLTTASSMENKAKSNTYFMQDEVASRLRRHGLADASGELARVDFVQDACEAFIQKALPGKNVGECSGYAWGIYNAARNEKLASKAAQKLDKDGNLVRDAAPALQVKASRKSELAQAMQASLINPALVATARQATVDANALIEANTPEDKNPKTLKSYDAIISIAREQIARAKSQKEAGATPSAMSLQDMIDVLTAEKETAEKSELDRLEKIIKELNSMVEKFPDNADAYTAAVEGMRKVHAHVQLRAEEAQAAAKAADLAARKAALGL